MSQARLLIELGALWNIFIVAASVQALLSLYDASFAPAMAVMRKEFDPSALEEFYRTLPMIDFSRDLLQGNESKLRVLSVPPCGWTDLGTPARVARLVHRVKEEFPRLSRLPEGVPVSTHAHLSLMDQYLRQEHTLGL